MVTHAEKPGKYRVTQDAAAKVHGHSLNHYLLNGPDLLNKLVGIMLRFRRYQVVLTADIRDFFFQVEIDPVDAPACRYLWWKTQAMKVVIVLQALVHLMVEIGAKCCIFM